MISEGSTFVALNAGIALDAKEMNVEMTSLIAVGQRLWKHHLL
jgi:hypothetical protein